MILLVPGWNVFSPGRPNQDLNLKGEFSMPAEVFKVVILARGLGTRMRRQEANAAIDDRQSRVAETGMKGMIPVGRPFMDHLLSSLADAGYRQACLVIGPEHDAVRDYYRRQIKPTRITVAFAIQAEPRGTADAVAAAEAFAGADRFLVINSDNFYPPEILRGLRNLKGMGLVGFERLSLILKGNLAAERVMQFPVLQIDEHGILADILEPSDAREAAGEDGEVFISMNCWLLGPAIFQACRAISPSPNGELELPVAVGHAVRVMHEAFEVMMCREGVLDLSTRGDISIVTRLLAGREVQL